MAQWYYYILPIIIAYYLIFPLFDMRGHENWTVHGSSSDLTLYSICLHRCGKKCNRQAKLISYFLHFLNILYLEKNNTTQTYCSSSAWTRHGFKSRYVSNFIRFLKKYFNCYYSKILLLILHWEALYVEWRNSTPLFCLDTRVKK